jgi:hypothetical protein
MTQVVSTLTADEVHNLRDRIYAEGVVGLKGAFPVEWVDQLRKDVDRAFVEARSRPHGAVGRGPNRYYTDRSELH